jgi:hypothetical protein
MTIVGNDVISVTFIAGGLVLAQEVQEYGWNDQTGVLAVFFAAGVAVLKIVDARLEKTRSDRQKAMEESMARKDQRVEILEAQILQTKQAQIDQQGKVIDQLLEEIKHKKES